MTIIIDCEKKRKDEKMKKLVSTLIVLLLTALLVACNNSAKDAVMQAADSLRAADSLVAVAEAEAAAATDVAEAVRQESSSEPPAQPSSGWTTIGNGFSYRGVSFSSSQGFTTALGEVRNESNKTYMVTLFTLNVYDASGALIDAGMVGVENFGAGQVKSFQSLFTKDLSARASVGMTFDSGHGVTY